MLNNNLLIANQKGVTISSSSSSITSSPSSFFFVKMTMFGDVTAAEREGIRASRMWLEAGALNLTRFSPRCVNIPTDWEERKEEEARGLGCVFTFLTLLIQHDREAESFSYTGINFNPPSSFHLMM